MKIDVFKNTVFSPYRELIAYEYLWSKEGSSLKKISDKLNKGNILPSEYLQSDSLFPYTSELKEIEDYIKPRLKQFSIIFRENVQYSQKLLNSKYPANMFYYKGNLDYFDSPCISIVGTRNMTREGGARAHKLSKELSKYYTIVSGLAKGIDTVALKTAIENKGHVIGVIGTPIDRYYPKENQSLQDYIGSNYLLISQVPIYKYDHQPFSSKRNYFPERNVTMAAISEATVIVEASETSGTHVQARACFEQGKKLFILNSCFENKAITWPQKYLEKGAYRINSVEEIFEILNHK